MLIGKNPLNKSPEWFTRNIEIEPENNSVEVDGALINFNVWGDKSLPGLILLHGFKSGNRYKSSINVKDSFTIIFTIIGK